MTLNEESNTVYGTWEEWEKLYYVLQTALIYRNYVKYEANNLTLRIKDDNIQTST